MPGDALTTACARDKASTTGPHMARHRKCATRSCTDKLEGAWGGSFASRHAAHSTRPAQRPSIH
eukprot:12701541-Alexandrium_andersonii.AAC.1